jgi:CRISPR/Cas system CSM-associated protein Csm3 (group 7 of RAMP superfamily)
MKTYRLTLKLLSPTLIGSGEGFGALIDTDIVFDEVGLPLVPAKRIKGCLRDAANEVCGMMEQAQMPCHQKIKDDIGLTFGDRGQGESAPVYFSNLTLEDYAGSYAWLNYFLQQHAYPDLLSREKIVESFTNLRQQTKINPDGVAEDHSLRTIRVLKTGLRFSGDLTIENVTQHDQLLAILLLACANFRAIGTKRNRGLGDVRCTLWEGNTELSLHERWEGIIACTT